MEYVKSFRDLEVYKLARLTSKEIFELSKTFPKEEMYSLTDQIRRSSRSIGAQIAEAWPRGDMKNILLASLLMPMANNWKLSIGLKQRTIVLTFQLNLPVNY